MAGAWRLRALPLVHLALALVLLSQLAPAASTHPKTRRGDSSSVAYTPAPAPAPAPAVYSPEGGGAEPVFKETWVITTEIINGDCLANRPTTVVNKQYPGPLVKVTEGTRVLITVKNEQEIPVTLHWHGMKQNNSQWHDGVGQVTQCDIQKGETFTYNFSTWGHAGNMWWHAHVVAIRNTVLGGLIVTPHSYDVPGRKAPPMGDENIAGEHVILMTDWYESSSQDLVTGTVGYPFSGWPPPDTLHINGRTRVSCQSMAEFEVEPRKWYYMRVTNGALYATLNFIVQHHNLWTYESEGGYLKVRRFKTYDIMSGQSYTFLMYTSQKPGAYFVGARPRYDIEGYGGLPGLGILRYKGFDKKKLPKGRGVYVGPNLARNPYFTEGQLLKTKGATKPPEWIHKVDQLIVLQMNMHNNKNDKGQQVTRYSWNNFTTMLPTAWAPLEAEWQDSKASLANLNPGQIPVRPPAGIDQAVNQQPSVTGFSTVDLQFNATIQIVFNGHNPPGLNHPIHLHGHNFYVVASGMGKFNSDKWESYAYNLKNPVHRNTAWLLEGGWTAVRFRADNPGIWLMHCHLEPHVEAGMMVVFRTHVKGAIAPPPEDYPTCTAPASR